MPEVESRGLWKSTREVSGGQNRGQKTRSSLKKLQPRRRRGARGQRESIAACRPRRARPGQVRGSPQTHLTPRRSWGASFPGVMGGDGPWGLCPTYLMGCSAFPVDTQLPLACCEMSQTPQACLSWRLPLYRGHFSVDKQNVGGYRPSRQPGMTRVVVWAGSFPSGPSASSSVKGGS